MKKMIFLILIMLSSAMSAIATSAPFRVRHLDVSPGFSNTMVNKVMEDSKGFIWIGTSAGLFRYDGFSLMNFRGESLSDKSVLNNYVEDLQEDGEGRLWVKADGKWRVYDPASGRLVDDAHTMLKEWGATGTLSTVFIDEGKTIWLGMEDGSVYSVGDGKARRLTLPTSAKGSVTEIISAGDAMACITTDGTLTLIDPSGSKVLKSTKAPEIADDNVQYIYVAYADRMKRLWMICNDRIMLYDLNSGKWLNGHLPENGQAGVVKNVFQDKEGTIWIARDHQGVEKVVAGDGGIRFEKVDIEGDLVPNNTVTSIFEDSSGTLWFGTYKRGLFFHNGSADKFGMAPFADTNCMLQAGDGWLWMGTDDSGLWKWNPSTGERIHFPDPSETGLPSAVTALANGPDGTLYIGSFSRGIRTMKNGKFSRMTTGSDLDCNYVWTLLTDKSGNLWAGTLGGGLYKLNTTTGEVATFKTSNSALPSDYVESSLMTKDGKLYFGTSNGLSVFNPVSGQLQTYLNEESNSNPGAQKINQIYEDSRGLLWLATRNGLKVIDRSHRRILDIPLRDNIEQLFVHSVIEDNGGGMWVSEGSNLVNLKVDFDRRSGSLKIDSRTYDSRDGLQNSEFNQRSLAKLPSGEILLGGFYGVNRFLPSDIKYNSTKPRVMFSDFFIGQKRILAGEEGDGVTVLKKNVESGGTAELGHDVKEFSVYFGTDNYALPGKTVFQYRMLGFNDSWASLHEGVNHVTYTNLSPGRYTLQVRAINNDGYESETPAELHIYVHAPFWATPIAYVVYAILAALLVYFLARMFRKAERRRFERQLKEDERNREEELNQLKFRFFTNVSHDLRTPLSLIISPLDAMLKESNDERQTRRLGLMRENAGKLLNLVNQLLDFRKIELKGLQLNPSEGDIVAFTKEICSSFSGLSERKAINLTFYSSQQRIMMEFDSDKMGKALMNLLGNAFKFTPSGGRVDVSLELTGQQGDNLRLKVSDTGVGVPDKDKEHIFERFFQVGGNEESRLVTGSGIGLSMVSEYVGLHLGSVHVADNPGGGSVFVVDIPVRRKAAVAAPANEGTQEVVESVAQTGESDGQSTDIPQEEKRQKKGKGLPVALVVDDNPDMLEMLKDGLEGYFEVVTAADGIEALEKLKSLTPSIILADLMMPRMDGIELTLRLKESPDTAGIPIIILTARHDLNVKVEGLTLGADDYITKPFNFDVVRLRMQRLVELTAHGATRKLIDPEPEKIKITSLDEKLVGKAVEYVSANIASPDLSVEDLASHLGMSRVRLYKKLKQITGKTPIEFIRVMRLKRAAQLLRESQLNVSEIAYQTGFNNPKVFSKYFKEEFGILPSVYQDRESSASSHPL